MKRSFEGHARPVSQSHAPRVENWVDILSQHIDNSHYDALSFTINALTTPAWEITPSLFMQIFAIVAFAESFGSNDAQAAQDALARSLLVASQMQGPSRAAIEFLHFIKGPHLFRQEIEYIANIILSRNRKRLDITETKPKTTLFDPPFYSAAKEKVVANQDVVPSIYDWVIAEDVSLSSKFRVLDLVLCLCEMELSFFDLNKNAIFSPLFMSQIAPGSTLCSGHVPQALFDLLLSLAPVSLEAKGLVADWISFVAYNAFVGFVDPNPAFVSLTRLIHHLSDDTLFPALIYKSRFASPTAKAILAASCAGHGEWPVLRLPLQVGKLEATRFSVNVTLQDIKKLDIQGPWKEFVDLCM